LATFPVHSLECRGFPFSPVKTCLKFWGFPWKLIWNYGSRNYFKSNFVRPWSWPWRDTEDATSPTVYSAVNNNKKYVSHVFFDYYFLFLKNQLCTGWRRSIGCLRLQVICRKRATNYRALLRKMTWKDKASYRSSPPCSYLTIGYNFCIAYRFSKISSLLNLLRNITIELAFEKFRCIRRGLSCLPRKLLRKNLLASQFAMKKTTTLVVVSSIVS